MLIYLPTAVSVLLLHLKKSQISFLLQAWGSVTHTAAWSQLYCYKNRCISACVRSMLLPLKNVWNSNAGNNPFRPSHSFIPDLAMIKDRCSGANAEERHAEPWPSQCWVLFVSVTIATAVLWPADSRSMLDGGKEFKGCRHNKSNGHRVEVTLPFEPVTSKCMCVHSGMLPYKGILNKISS